MNEKSIFKDGANKNLTHPQNEKGITLIALVVTIVVLLILAAVSISMLAGENGIIRQAQEAKEETESAEIEENEKLDNLEKYIEEAVGGDKWESILADANSNPEKYKSTEQLSSEYIAIGTDGEPVNMDLWNPTKLADGTWLLGVEGNYNRNNAYAGEYINGEIQGEVPQYIYSSDTNTFKPVTEMCSTFAFSSLEKAPKLPDTVSVLEYTFAMCFELTDVSQIPSSVVNIKGLFYTCDKLGTVPAIPSSVTNMNYTFYDCINLTGTIIINANPDAYSNCFACTEKPIVLTGSSTMLQTLASAANNVTVSQ